MTLRCSGYVMASVGFGTNCAVCGYPERHKNHEAEEPGHTQSRSSRSSVTQKSRAKPRKITRTTQMDELISSRAESVTSEVSQGRQSDVDDGASTNRDLESTYGDDDPPSSQRSLQFTQSRRERASESEKTKQKKKPTSSNRGDGKGQGRSLSAALERQCNLHTLAADAARHVGHPDKAFEHYEEAVTCAEKLERTRRRKDAEKKKSHTQGKHHRHASTWGAPEARDERPRRSLEQTDPSGSWNVSEPPAKVEREWGAAATMREDPQRGDGHRDGRRGYLDRDVLDNDRREEHANSGSTKSLLTTAGYDDQIQERLKLIFMKFSGGAPGLSKPGFEDLLEDAGCPGKASQYWAAFDRDAKKSWIGLSEFALGCAALDPLTPHTGRWRAERAKYIFRFYSRGKPTLSADQLREIGDHIDYIADSRGAQAEMFAATHTHSRKPMPLRDFVHLVSENKIRGTSRLLRFSFLDHVQA